MVRIAEALLEREILDSNEVRMLIEGQSIPASAASTERKMQQTVSSPEGNVRVPGLMEGPGPQPA